MFKLVVVVLALALAVAYAGHHGGHGHGGHGWGHKYVGWANVDAWASPWAYQYGLKEHGSGYNKYIWQGQDFKGHGHGGWKA